MHFETISTRPPVQPQSGYLTISRRRRREYRRRVVSVTIHRYSRRPRRLIVLVYNTLMTIQENKIIDQFPTSNQTSLNLAAFLKTASLQCYNHRVVIIAG